MAGHTTDLQIAHLRLYLLGDIIIANTDQGQLRDIPLMNIMLASQALVMDVTMHLTCLEEFLGRGTVVLLQEGRAMVVAGETMVDQALRAIETEGLTHMAEKWVLTDVETTPTTTETEATTKMRAGGEEVQMIGQEVIIEEVQMIGQEVIRETAPTTTETEATTKMRAGIKEVQMIGQEVIIEEVQMIGQEVIRETMEAGKIM